VRPIFVLGVPRSGTTWVLRILGAHPRAFPLLETYMFSSRIGLGALFAPLGPAPVPGAEPPAPGLARPGIGRLLSRPELVEEVRAIARRWLRRAAPPGVEYVIDKSPWHLAEAPLIGEVLPEARFVHVVRDGRDVAISLLAARRSWSDFGGARTGATVREAATLWRRGMRQGGAAAAELEERLLEVRYERLHDAPRAAIAGLLSHCGMPFDDDLVATIAAETDFAAIPERGDGGLYRGGRVGDWRRSLGVLAGARFEAIAGDALRAAGYPAPRGWWLRPPVRTRLERAAQLPAADRRGGS
jgi:hypothetical protein